MACFIEFGKKKEVLMYKKNIYFHEKYSTELSIDDQNSLWNTEIHK